MLMRFQVTSAMMKLTSVRVLMNVEFRTKIANRWSRTLGRCVTVDAVLQVVRLTLTLVLTILRLQLTVFMTFFPPAV